MNSLIEIGILTVIAFGVFAMSVNTRKRTGWPSALVLFFSTLTGLDYMAYIIAGDEDVLVRETLFTQTYMFRSLLFSLNSCLAAASLAFVRSYAAVRFSRIGMHMFRAAVVYTAAEVIMFIVTPFTGLMFSAREGSSGEFEITGYSPLFFLHGIFLLIMAGAVIYSLLSMSRRADEIKKLLYYTVIVFVLLICVMNTFTILTACLMPDIAVALCILFGIVIYSLVFFINRILVIQLTKKETFDRVDNPVIVFDHNRRLLDYNRAAMMTFGIDSRDVAVCSESDFIRRQKMSLETAAEPGDYEVMTSIGDIVKYFDLNIKDLKENNGIELGRLYMMNDITRIKEMSLKLEKNIMNDPLTGLYNKQAFDQMAADIDNIQNYPVCVAYIDINGLMEINEVMGMTIGDSAIKAVASIVEKNCKKEFAAARINNCIVMLMPRTNETSAVKILDNIKEAVSHQEDFIYPMSVEYGVVEKNNSDDSMVISMREAYDSMLRKKMLNPQSPRYSLVRSLVALNEDLSHSSFGHSERVTNLAELMCVKLGLNDSEKSEIRLFAMLHYVGMFTVPTRIIMKTEPLTEDEWNDVKENSEKGYKLINMLGNLTAMSPVAMCMLALHERWDGLGYPNGLMGEEIPFQARLISIISSFDIMIHGSYYRNARTVPEALEEIRNCEGSQFDPELAESFIEMVKEEKITGVDSITTREEFDNLDFSAEDYNFFEMAIKDSDGNDF